MKDSYWRRGLLSVVKGIATFGVRKPFVSGAHFSLLMDAQGLFCKASFSYLS